MDPGTATKICPACGTVVAEAAKFCSQCAQGLDPASIPRAPAKAKWYHNLWFVLFMLFFVLGPFGLPLVWRNPRFSRGVKVLLTAVTTLYTLWLVDLTIGMTRAIMQRVNQFNTTLQF